MFAGHRAHNRARPGVGHWPNWQIVAIAEGVPILLSFVTLKLFSREAASDWLLRSAGIALAFALARPPGGALHRKRSRNPLLLRTRFALLRSPLSRKPLGQQVLGGGA